MSKYKKITVALASATCGLMGVTDAQAGNDTESDVAGWDLSSAYLFYTEPDRVSAIEAVLKGKKQLDTDESITLKLTVDSLTGASASGAVATDRVQTFTRPSGNGSYTTASGQTPLDDTFQDTRVALNASWEKPLSRMVRLTTGGNVSKEYDYTSLSANSVVAVDTHQRNTTWSAGASFSSDTFDPVGGVPTPFGRMMNQGAAQPRSKTSEDKTIAEALFGVTQVIDRNSLMRFNYSLSQSDGYLTDPYKVLSVVGADGRPLDAGNGLSSVVFENRPDSRAKHSLFGQYKRYIDGNVLDTSYRYSTDDWGMNAHTLDARYRVALSDTSYLQPHVRYYQQSAVDFHKPFFTASDVPASGDSQKYASADYRLGDMSTYTVGLEYGRTDGRPWSVSGEYYLQTNKEPDNKFGELTHQTLAPDVDAVMLRFNYDF